MADGMVGDLDQFAEFTDAELALIYVIAGRGGLSENEKLMGNFVMHEVDREFRMVRGTTPSQVMRVLARRVLDKIRASTAAEKRRGPA